MAELTSPNVQNYGVLKGEVYWTPAGGARRHLGNCTQFALEIGVERLDHFSSMAGVRTKDFSIVLEKTATVSLTLEELTLKNFQMALLGGDIAPDSETTDAGLDGFPIGAESEINGALELINTNDVGPQYKITLPSVNISPAGAIEFIGDDDWGNMELTGDVLVVNGSFGRFNLLDSATT